MQILGDIERLFAVSLYPLRIPIAVGLTIGVVMLLVWARRRGWFAAARRHPGRAGALLVVALVAGLPVGYYLASPLFIRTELVEPDPVAAARPTTRPSTPTVTVAPTASSPVASTPAAASSPAPEATPFVPAVHASGSFSGTDEFHFGKGTASIIETAPGEYALRFKGFSVRNGPDLYVYLSPDPAGYADGALEVGALKATDGAFGYVLPKGSRPADFASAVIWCKQFAVQFAVAPLEAV